MMPQPATLHSRPTLWDGLVVLCILCATGLLLWLFRPVTSDALELIISWEQEELGCYTLTQDMEPVTLTLDQLDYPLTIQMEEGRVCVSHSSCPGADCVHSGWISSSGRQIVCLPNQLILTVTGISTPQVDGVTS